MKINDNALKIMNKLEKMGYEAFIAGETAISLIFGNEASEFLMLTNAPSDKISYAFKNIYRKTDSNICIISGNIKIVLKFYKASIFEHIKKYVFTIDTVLINSLGSVIDYYNGVAALRDGLLTTVFDPDFKEQPQLILQGLRICCEKNLELSDYLKAQILLSRPCLKKIPKSVVFDQLSRMLMSENPIKLQLLQQLSVFYALLPALDKCFYEPQKNKYHIYNVGEHILHTVENTPADLEIRWAALFHDIGKPLCASADSNGTIHFFGHHTESSRIANTIFLGFNANEEFRSDVYTLIEYHDVRFEQNKPSIKRMLGKIGYTLFMKLLDLQDGDSKAKNPKYISDKLAATNKIRSIAKEIIENGEPYRYSDLSIGKRDLIKMKYHAEREMRNTLRILLDEVIADEKKNTRDYLISRAYELKAHQ